MYTFNVGCTESAMFIFPFIPTEYLTRFNIVSASRPRFASGFFKALTEQDNISDYWFFFLCGNTNVRYQMVAKYIARNIRMM